MTQAPATGLYGPGDYGPDFDTLDEVYSAREYHQRSSVVTALLDLAHDLDARGLVLMSEDEVEERIIDAHTEGAVQGYSDGCERY